MKKTEWINGNHMKFESLNKTFNRQVDCISTGNVWGSVQWSGYIRAYNQTSIDNGSPYKEGELQEFDLKQFRDMTPGHIISEVKKETQNEGAIFYCLFHWSKGKRIVHGWILTTKDYKQIAVWYANYRSQSISVIYNALPYLINE